MRASRFEFHRRFWFITGIYLVAFSASALDHRSAVDWLAARLAGTPLGSGLVLVGFATVCVTVAAWLRTWGAAYLRSDVVHDRAVHTDAVVADGPYRHVRNPLYLGTLVQAIGFSLIASRLGAVLLVVLMSTFVLRLIGREEAELVASQGDRYRAYRAAVPKLLPALRPRLASGGRRAAWGQAFLGETFSWMLALAVGSFMVVHGPRFFYIFLGAGFAIYAVTTRLQRRGRRAGR
jgi:protein-S-isoprenylcysteine O-methyltransferase Ste14